MLPPAMSSLLLGLASAAMSAASAAGGDKFQGRITPQEDPYSEIPTVEMGEHPYLAAVVYMERHMCSGALINPQFVLTTATCFKDLVNKSRVYVHLGSYSAADDFVLEEQVWKIVLHPNSPRVPSFGGPFGRGPRSDAALLAFRRPTIINFLIQPIRAALMPVDFGGFTATIVGWRSLPFPKYLPVVRRSDYMVLPSGATWAVPPDIHLSRQGKRFADTHQPGSPVVVHSVMEDALYLIGFATGDQQDVTDWELRIVRAAHVSAWIEDVVVLDRGNKAMEWNSPE